MQQCPWLPEEKQSHVADHQDKVKSLRRGRKTWTIYKSQERGASKWNYRIKAEQRSEGKKAPGSERQTHIIRKV